MQGSRIFQFMVVGLFLALAATRVHADMFLNKLSTDDPVVDVAAATLDNERITFALTNKKVMALSHEGKVITELAGLEIGQKIAVTGNQIYVIGSQKKSDAMVSLIKYRWSGRKITLVGKSDNIAHTVNFNLLMIYKTEVWCVETHNASANGKWVIKQYLCGGDDTLPKPRTARHPQNDSPASTSLEQVLSNANRRPLGWLSPSKITKVPNKDEVLFAVAAYPSDSGTEIFQLAVTDTNITEKKRTTLSKVSGEVRDMIATTNYVYTCAESPNKGLYIYRLPLDLNVAEKKTAYLEKVTSAGKLRFGSLSETANGIFVMAAVDGSTVKLMRGDGTIESDKHTLTGTTNEYLVLARLKDDLSSWTNFALLPADGGSSPLLEDPLTRPFIAPGNSSVLAIGSLSGGTAKFSANRELSDKSSFAIPFTSSDLKFLDETITLTVVAEVKDSSGNATELPLPQGEVSPALGVVPQAPNSLVTVQMPEHAYELANGGFLKLQGLTQADINERIKSDDVVARYTPVGYTVTREAGAQIVTGTGASVTVVMTPATNVTFHFKRDYALTISSVVDAPGVDNSQLQALGNPDPPAVKQWVEENAVVAPQVDGVASSPSDAGTRFVTTSFSATGAAAPGRGWSADNPRQQVPQFVMTGSSRITYNWIKQHSITVYTSTSKSAGLPAITFTGATLTGTGTFWIRNGTRFIIGAADDAGIGESMRGVLNSGGQLQDLNGYAKEQFSPAHSFNSAGRTYAGKLYGSLDGPGSITWDYGATIYRQVVSIGDAVDLTGANAVLFPSAVRLIDSVTRRIDVSKSPSVTAVLEAPPGSDAAGMMIWSAFDRKAYPVRPGRFLLQWPVTDGGAPVVTEVTSGFPGDTVRHPALPASSYVNIRNLAPEEISNITPLKNTVAGQPNTLATDADLTAGHTPQMAFNNNTFDKFFMRQGLNSGLAFRVRQAIAPSSLHFASGNDLPSRDPITFTLEGSNVSSDGPWTRLQDFNSGRTYLEHSDGTYGRSAFAGIPIQIVPGPAYTYFRVLFPTVRSGTEIQYSEIRIAAPYTSPMPIFPGVTRNYRCLVHESMPPVDLDRSAADGQAFKRLAFSAALTASGGTDVPAAEIATPAVPPVLRDGKLLSFPVLASNLRQAEGKHVLVMTKATPGASATGDEAKEGLVVRVLETRRWNSDKEWGKGTKGAVRKFQSYSFIPKQTSLKTSPATILQELTFYENGQERRPVRVEASNASRANPTTTGDPNRLIDAGGANLAYSDSTKTSPIIFYFSEPVAITGVRLQAGSAPGELDSMPVRFGVYGNITGTGGERLVDYENENYVLTSLDGAGATPVIPFNAFAYELIEGPMVAAGGDVTIGSRLTDIFYDFAGIGTGFVVGATARYNPNIYDRSLVANAGPIIPVNRQFTRQVDDEMAVIWYENADNILWPWRPVTYTPKWPVTKDRIVIASRLGSDGVDSDKAPQMAFDKTLYSEVEIYHQPDPALPGFNPNEEHALVSGSLQYATIQNPPLAAYALRNDLNIGTRPENADANAANDIIDSNYTSDPFVLVQYLDTNSGEHRMKVYKVEKEDGSIGLLDGAPSAPDPFSLKVKAAAFSNAARTHIFYLASPSLVEGEQIQIQFGGVIGGVTSGSFYFIKKFTANTYGLSGQAGGLALGQDSTVNLTSEVQITRSHPYVFHYPTTAGLTITAPNPLDLVIGLSASPETFGGNLAVYNDVLNPPARVYYEDYAGTPWAVAKGDCFTSFFYRMRNDFWFKRTPGGAIAGTTDAGAQVPSGVSIAFAPTDASKNEPQQVKFSAHWPDNTPVLKVGESLTFAGGEYKQDHPDADGLPGVVGWASGRVVFDSLNPAMDNTPAPSVPAVERAQAATRTFTNYSVRLISPLETRLITLASTGMSAADIASLKQAIAPATGITEVDGVVWQFTNLPASLKNRIFFDPIANQIGVRGYLNDKTLGDTTLTASPPPAYILEPNILSPRDRTTLLEFKANRAEDTDLRTIVGGDKWSKLVEALYTLSRNPAGVRKSFSSTADLADYYAGMDWAPQRDARGNILVFGRNGAVPAGASASLIPPGSSREEGKPIPTIGIGAPPKVTGPGLALVPSPLLLDPNPADPAAKAIVDRQFKNPDDALYVTVAENDDAAIGGPVSMHIIKIVKKHHYRGALKLVEGDNAFSEKVTLRHTGDFGGNAEDLVYEWYYRPEDGVNQPWPYKEGRTVLPWQVFPDDSGRTPSGSGMNEISVAGKGKFILPDLWFITRYRHKNDVPATASWAGTEHAVLGKPDADVKKGELWAGAANSPQPNGDYLPQLVPGWLKRVLDRINPYEARITDFRQDAPATYISMIQQAGPRYVGPVALNPDKNVVENVGLIELYQTLLERGSKFAFAETITDPGLKAGIMNALQSASTRIQDLYMVLGNEAYSDALDPLVGFGSNSAEYGSSASSIWAFMNETSSPLEEELALLRGGSFDFGRPVHNRLFWNFTKDLGEVAYAQTYNLSDENGDGFINESDAMLRYPQGHGDAWGHYTTAVKMHYKLLHNPKFAWQPRSEFYNLLDVVVPVDFYDERKFAFAASSRAKAGADIVSLTYRQRYTENPDGQWQGYSDTDTDRSWGVQEWARRAGEAALLDWATANSLIPAEAINGGRTVLLQPVSTLDGRSYGVTLALGLRLMDVDTAGNAVRYLLTITPPGQTARQIIFQPGGPSQSTMLSITGAAKGASSFRVSFTDNIAVPGLVAGNFSLAFYERPEGIQRVDRTTTTNISQIASEFARIETTLRNADTGLNPLGLADGAVPFDIDPNAFAGRDVRDVVSHFQQIYERARKAVDNAHTIFNGATEQLNQVRRQQDSLDAFAGDVADGDRELRNRLIEIFGTPHAGNIGAGKAYPTGYNGPDLYYHMYVDVKDVSAETVPYAPAANDTFKALYAGFQQQLVLTDENNVFLPKDADADTRKEFNDVIQKLFLRDIGADADGDGIPEQLAASRNVSIVDSGDLELNLPIRASGYAFQKPAEWGSRASTGELQTLISDMVQAEADLALAIDAYTGEVDAIKDAGLSLESQYGIALEQVQLLTKGKENFVTLAKKIAALESAAAALNLTADVADDLTGVILDNTPDLIIAGTAAGGNAPKAAKIPGYVLQRAATIVARYTALGLELGAINLGPDLETENFDVAISEAKLSAKLEIQQKLIELKTMLGGEGPARIAVFHAVEVLRQLSDAYRTKLHQGMELLNERQTFNRNAAGAVQEYRYQDMTFRVFHNEALEKYRASFDLAARYTWLAAKAYDYETNLDAADPGSAQGILEDIVKARTVGDIVNGEPVLGDGLAGTLAALRDNYEVLSGQMGLNNAQLEDSKISLRMEKFRITKDVASDADWRAKLTEFRKNDLWEVPEFRRYCRPFAAAGTVQPGLVIPLETSIVAGKNLFGLPLGPGDHAFDPTLFATKVNAVGVWFESYDLSKLSVAPRVYLVPAGMDVMTVPNSPDLQTRAWNIVDQRIPVPHILGSSPLGLENWRPVRDTLDGPIGEIRKFSSFRAYGSAASSATVDTGEMNYDSRLVGRSVWNTKWLLIIPGITFNADANTGLNTLISADGIKDIKLVIKTSGFSGN